ncbi:zinc finger-domain-containing protein [Pseudomonas syringae]|uniref:Zinc finger-domain-containing protein n=1 Tax=Pseudomonas syringae TaxID=317 RepID=A0A1C7ZBX2_PSESX|nr:DUF3426 domain-containing protein [Pseudomonas syringae]OCR26537.1 zinc finger-domain-containing protein [Pseudomonas syringae]
MTDSFVTQCPHCQTSFRVSHAQLSVARGVVRCGACLQVFNAAKQLLEQRGDDSVGEAAKPPAPTFEPAPAIVAPPAVQAPPALVAVEPSPEAEPEAIEIVPAPRDWKANALDLDDMDLDEELARLEQREIQLPETFGRERSRADGDANLSAHRDKAHSEEDEWVTSLRNDDVSQLPELQAEVIPEPQQSLELEPEPEQEQTSGNGRTEPSLSLNPVGLGDEEPMAPQQSQRKAPGSEKKERWSALDDDDHDHEQDHEPQPEPQVRGRRNRSEPAVRDKTLVDLTDEPLQLEWQRPKSHWGRRLIWTLLAILALAGLAGQYIWYHFDELARQDQYRPWFQLICPQIDCKVPSKVDIKLLKSSNLVVRSHPEFKGALVVDAIIYNRASFSQPFPLLELRFADTSGQLIASRRFKPAEYLSGEMAGKEEMPPQTPIHIALDILDPGAKAVNYSLSFRSPE